MFGTRLRELRENAGLSQQDAAAGIKARFGLRISQTSLSALEHRDTAPRGDVLEALAGFYGVEPIYFVDQAPADGDRIAEALAYLESLNSRTWHSGPAHTGGNVDLWQPPLGVDEYMDT